MLLLVHLIAHRVLRGRQAGANWDVAVFGDAYSIHMYQPSIF